MESAPASPTSSRAGAQWFLGEDVELYIGVLMMLNFGTPICYIDIYRSCLFELQSYNSFPLTWKTRATSAHIYYMASIYSRREPANRFSFTILDRPVEATGPRGAGPHKERYLEPELDLYCGPPTTQNMVYSYQNRGHMGSRYIYIYIS